ncbi:hypothetical protein HZS_5747 [Henneguya salminicola]|nr:hypothetical protein HZS_5747 [Henneguya salminicola]
MVFLIFRISLVKFYENKKINILILHCKETSHLTSSQRVLPDQSLSSTPQKFLKNILVYVLSKNNPCKIVIKIALNKFGRVKYEFTAFISGFRVIRLKL